MFDKEERAQLKKLKDELKRAKLLKKTLLNKDTDWSLLEQLIQSVNENPELEISVNLRDGTTLKLKTVKKQEGDPFLS